jgi:replication factor C large subunit
LKIGLLLFCFNFKIMLWTEKHSPQKFREFTGNPSAIARVKEWGNAWKQGVKQKPLLFFGSTGIGKTLLAEIVSKELNWQLFELNASDFRNKDIIERIAGAAALNSSFTGGLRLVLLDEIDGLQGTADKGGAAAIGALLKAASQPVILTCNEIYGDAGKKLSGIKAQCELVKFDKPRFDMIAKFLERICEIEGIDYDQKVLAELAKAANGDIRSAILDLQTLAQASKKITLEDLKDLGFRERQVDVFKVLQKIFHAKTLQECQIARNSAEIDSEMLQAWVEENIPRHFKHSDDLSGAFDYLSKADIFNARIMRRQHYGFLRYSTELATSGVAIQREHHYPGFVGYQFPSKISSLGATKGFRAGKKGVAEKMKAKMHGSVKQIMNEDLAFLQPLLKDEKKLIEWSALFDFDDGDLAFLTGKKADGKWVKNLLKEAEELKKKLFAGKRKALQGASLVEIQEARKELPEEEIQEIEKPKKIEPDKAQTRLF